jgi:hypothetical protein
VVLRIATKASAVVLWDGVCPGNICRSALSNSRLRCLQGTYTGARPNLGFDGSVVLTQFFRTICNMADTCCHRNYAHLSWDVLDKAPRACFR